MGSEMCIRDRDKPELISTARKRVDEILTTHYPVHVSDQADAEIRKDFTVLFDRNASAE